MYDISFFNCDFRLQFALQTIIGLKETGIESKWKVKSFSTDAKEEVKDVEWSHICQCNFAVT